MGIKFVSAAGFSVLPKIKNWPKSKQTHLRLNLGTSLASVRSVGRADGNPWEQSDEEAATTPAMTLAGRWDSFLLQKC